MPSGAAIANITAAHRWFINEGRALVFTVTDRSGNRVDMTGKTVVWAYHKNQGDPLAHVVLSGADITFTSTLVDAVLDEVNVDSDPDDFVGLQAGRHYHALIEDGDPDDLVLAEGFVDRLPGPAKSSS